MKESIRVLVADDHPIVRVGVTLLLNKEPDIKVIAEASDGKEAVERALDLKPDIVMMDLSMPPGENGLEATKRLKKSSPEIQVLILTAHDDEAYLFQVLQAGASGYILKSALETDLISAVRIVSKGEGYLYPSAAKTLVENLVDRTRQGKTHSSYHLLSLREREILIFIARGFSNKEIAEQLYLSVKTVETHKSRIMEKLGFQKRHELVDYALKRGLLTLDSDLS